MRRSSGNRRSERAAVRAFHAGSTLNTVRRPPSSLTRRRRAAARRSFVMSLEERHDLPALELGKLGPIGHAAEDHAVRQNPEERARRCLPDRFLHQARPPPRTLASFPVAFGAMLLEELAARRHGIGILLEGVALGCRMRRYRRQLGVVVMTTVKVAASSRVGPRTTAASEEAANHVSKARDFSRHGPAHQHAVTVLVEAEGG